MMETTVDSIASGYEVENRLAGTEHWWLARTAAGFEVYRTGIGGSEPFHTESEARAYLEQQVLAFPRAHPDQYSVKSIDVHRPYNPINFDSVQPSLKTLAEEPTKGPHAQQRAEMPEAAVRPGPEPKPEERATETEDNTGEGFKTTAGRIADRFDQQVDQATRATASLKQDLDDYVLEGGNPYAAATGATLLDFAARAMGVTQGFLDTLRLGEGLSKGTLVGAQEDLERLLDVLPQTKIVRAMSTASMAWDLARMAEEAVATNDPKQAAAAAITVAFTIVGLATKGKTKPSKLAKSGSFSKRVATKSTEEVERSQVFRILSDNGVITKQPIKKSLGSWFQGLVSGKHDEYVGRLKNGDSIQIDDFWLGKDGRLIPVEMKFMGEATVLEKSGHLVFAAEKVDPLQRLARFAHDWDEFVSHPEILVNRVTAAEIYANIVDQYVPSLTIGG
jgi:hypothetical protein